MERFNLLSQFGKIISPMNRRIDREKFAGKPSEWWDKHIINIVGSECGAFVLRRL